MVERDVRIRITNESEEARVGALGVSAFVTKRATKRARLNIECRSACSNLDMALVGSWTSRIQRALMYERQTAAKSPY